MTRVYGPKMVANSTQLEVVVATISDPQILKMESQQLLTIRNF